MAGLGCNALWINPCFDSPFMDAGYDVRDYKLVAPRYGTNEEQITYENGNLSLPAYCIAVLTIDAGQ